MNIVVMRHGQAEIAAATDFERPLSRVGISQARTAGQRLSSLGLVFDEMWVSPYLRTQQTADAVQEELSISSRHSKDILVPESSPFSVVEALQKATGQSLLLVSHQPLVSGLVRSLAGSSYHVPMSPASMVLLEARIMAAGCAELKWLRHAPDFERE